MLRVQGLVVVNVQPCVELVLVFGGMVLGHDAVACSTLPAVDVTALQVRLAAALVDLGVLGFGEGAIAMAAVSAQAGRT